MDNLSEFCAPESKFKKEMIVVADNVSLRVATFTPPAKNDNPAVVFVAGWISLIEGWKEVLLEMTKDFTVYYIETREKISSRVKGKVQYGVQAIGQDVVTIISKLKLKSHFYIFIWKFPWSHSNS